MARRSSQKSKSSLKRQQKSVRLKTAECSVSSEMSWSWRASNFAMLSWELLGLDLLGFPWKLKV